jgi:hypothetical protein
VGVESGVGRCEDNISDVALRDGIGRPFKMTCLRAALAVVWKILGN